MDSLKALCPSFFDSKVPTPEKPVYRTFADLTEEIESYRINPKNHMKLPNSYAKTFTTAKKVAGTVAVILFLCFVVGYGFTLTGHLMDFPNKLIPLFQNISYTHLAIGLSVTVVLLGGASLVIRRALTKKDPYIDSTIGAMHGSEHVNEVAVFFVGRDKEVDAKNPPLAIHPGVAYLDTSTLKNGVGKAYLYGIKSVREHYSVSSVVTLSAAIYMPSVVALDTLRLAIAPIYIFVCWLIERFKSDPLYANYPNERKFELKDIGFATVESLWRIVSAPFYATAFLFATLYTLVDPFNGRKLGSAIERDWNDGVPLIKGFWSRQGPQKLWPGWKIFAPNGLHENGAFYMAGCWQPFGIVEFSESESGEIVIKGLSMTRVVDSEHGKAFHIFTREEIEQSPKAEEQECPLVS